MALPARRCSTGGLQPVKARPGGVTGWRSRLLDNPRAPSILGVGEQLRIPPPQRVHREVPEGIFIPGEEHLLNSFRDIVPSATRTSLGSRPQGRGCIFSRACETLWRGGFKSRRFVSGRTRPRKNQVAKEKSSSTLPRGVTLINNVLSLKDASGRIIRPRGSWTIPALPGNRTPARGTSVEKRNCNHPPHDKKT